MKLATVGTSWITERFLRAAAVTEGLEPYGVFSRSIDKANEFGTPHGATAFYDDYQQLLDDSKVEIVYIGAPNSLHFGYMDRAIDAGKAVICEKPFVSTMKEFQQIKRKVVEKRAFVFEAITTLSMPNFACIKENIKKIAPVRIAKVDFSQYSSRYPQLQAGERTNIFDPAFSGGALYDLGVYGIHLTVGLFGAPQDVVCFSNSEQYSIDTSGMLLLKYPDKVCNITFSKDTHSTTLTEFQGEHGYLTIRGSTGRCDHVGLALAGEEKRNVSLTQSDNPMDYEAAAFVKAIQNDDWDYVLRALNQSEIVMDVLCKARKSAGIVFAADGK
ncbi:Gfo/Idh/MocA family oxidoreductase [Hydrogenoanaerobacterium sp.]|uniref:Gfo/Idh/MocA family protein n=1 Tax=Hydrogenoanaerobacterium sp. TaxID=2953763 RepID=UPI00289A8B7C|nr:Gfo/Idh/MocA family oxidoreductase [Hydrogenoanaerobacterium sp.]